MGITKIEAAERQINTAVRLFLAEDDWISIHTLLAASGRILRDLADQRGTPTWLMFNSIIRPEKRREVWRGLNRAANFFKHADKDSNAILDIDNPLINEFAMFLNCLMFGDLERRWTPEMNVFMTWHSCIYPQYYNSAIYSEAEDPLLSEMPSLPRTQQMAAARSMLEHFTAHRPETMF